VLLGLAVIGPFLAFAIGWMIFPVPTSDEATLTQVATFTFADGQPLATVRPENVNRVKVTLDRIPLQTRQAVVATEDNTFYSNPGFDITGIFRAVYNQLTGGIGGGSTITQQYIKVSTGHDEVSLLRKYKEVVLAVKISREQTKDQILENYLNTIYLGRGAYGIQAAAKAYFNKDVKDLTVSESAMLAGIISAPSANAGTGRSTGWWRTSTSPRPNAPSRRSPPTGCLSPLSWAEFPTTTVTTSTTRPSGSSRPRGSPRTRSTPRASRSPPRCSSRGRRRPSRPSRR
jgi:membrane peptidoglycan carboxypeptidase